MSTETNEQTAAIDPERLAAFQERLSVIVYDGVGRLEAITSTPRHDEHIGHNEAHVAPDLGVLEDGPYKKHWHGKIYPERQISCINAEVLDALEVGYHVTGDNLVIRGIDLATFEKGDAIRVGNAVLVATGAQFVPCAVLGRRTSTTHVKALAAGRLRGTFFDATENATIRVGDEVERIILNSR